MSPIQTCECWYDVVEKSNTGHLFQNLWRLAQLIKVNVFVLKEWGERNVK